MSRQSKLVGAAFAVGLLLVAGHYVQRAWRAYLDRTPEGYKLLTAMPPSDGFEPTTLPTAPVLENQSSGDLAVNFGYMVGKIPYSYSLVLSFPDKKSTGRATVTARHASREASAETEITRRWDEPRKAYAVALQDEFMIEPAVPSLCIKAVIGPDPVGYDLRNASICIAQRDASGTCHAETLACGLIR